MGVSVKDSGAGIPEKELDAVVKKYVQSSGTKSNFGGTGLGLSISKRIVSDHGGRIRVENNVGRGATFCFTLPKSPALTINSSYLPQN
ncbi:MAG: ATP-binding protein [Proteobacteria bacterium]|nr:ATP-binding protein [Pseudomonadota bacterium]